MVITIFLCTPLRIRYLQPKILCSGKGEGFLEGRVFPITTKAIHKKMVAITSSIMEDDQTSDTSASESKFTSF